jgi:sec-independent protein translocase protein TatA
MITGSPLPTLALIPSMGWPEMLMIFGVILLIFGPQKLPEIADALGRSIRKFKSAATEIKSDIETEDKRKPKQD